MKQLKDAFQYRRVGPPYLTRQMIQHFNHNPHDSVTALLRKTGPFKSSRDAFPFYNSAWPITDEDARVLREHYQGLIDNVSLIGVEVIRTALAGLSFSLPLAGTLNLPAVAIDYVINEISGPLRNRLVELVVASVPGGYGRCGGMAFSALDFFLVGWPVNSFNIKPESGDLRQYIWNRLLDSLDLNALTFFEWLMVLHVLPVISSIASGILGAAAGSVIGGPLGAAVGAFVAGGSDVLGVGGADAVLDKTRDQWGGLRARLDHEAAWPVGLIYGGNSNPIDQHQVLAIGYEDHGEENSILTLWDNNWKFSDDTKRGQKKLKLNLRGSELRVTCNDDDKLNDIKGIICEEYAFKVPPASLRR